jgi:hypothetical protein
MPLGVVPQIGGFDELFEVGAMVVNVAAHPDFAFGGQIHHLRTAERTKAVFVAGRAERFNDLVGVKFHRACNYALRNGPSTGVNTAGGPPFIGRFWRPALVTLP